MYTFDNKNEIIKEAKQIQRKRVGPAMLYMFFFALMLAGCYFVIGANPKWTIATWIVASLPCLCFSAIVAAIPTKFVLKILTGK